MAKKAKSQADFVAGDDASKLMNFWREIVQGRLLVGTDEGPKEIWVPIEVRLRASEMLARHTMPKGARVVEDDEEEAMTTPDILRVAQMLEAQAADEQLRQAFEKVKARKRPTAPPESPTKDLN